MSMLVNKVIPLLYPLFFRFGVSDFKLDSGFPVPKYLLVSLLIFLDDKHILPHEIEYISFARKRVDSYCNGEVEVILANRCIQISPIEKVLNEANIPTI